MNGLSAFDRYIGIDYSGAETPRSSLKGRRVYMADQSGPPSEVPPPPSPRRYWTRREIAEWLVGRLSENRRTLVGIDHGSSFPIGYFEKYQLPRIWPAFLDDFQRHWPTDDDIYVDFVRDGVRGTGAARCGNTRWRRVTDERAGAKSVFHFDVPGSVAKSTHAGLPWLRYIRLNVPSVHFWPFDGWDVPTGRSVVAEVYGDEALRRRIVTTTNTTHSPLRKGCAAPTLTVHSRVSWLPLSRPLSAKQRKLRAGYWEFNEPGVIAPMLADDQLRPQSVLSRSSDHRSSFVQYKRVHTPDNVT